MYKSFVFVFSLLICFSSRGQDNELIYKVVLHGHTNEMKAIDDESGYSISYDWSNLDLEPTMNVGIWEPQYENLIFDDIFYKRATVVYNSQLQPIGILHHYFIPDIYPLSLERILLNFNSDILNSDYSIFPTAPGLTSYPSSTFGQGIFIDFNPTMESANGLMNFSFPLSNMQYIEPFTGYFNGVYGGGGNSVPSEFYKPTTILSDSVLISYLSLFDQQFLNEEFEYNNWEGQENMVRTHLNLETNELQSHQIGSGTGSQTTFLVESAKNDLEVYRVGLVRGNDTPVSISGAEVEMNVNDSLYHVFITKEFADGQTQWLTELYAYNNTNNDTALNYNAIQVRNRVFSLIENDDFIYVSASLVSRSEMIDSLLFRDFLGNDSLYNQEIPDGGSSLYQIPYSKGSVYKLDQNGIVKTELSYVQQLYGHETSNNFGGKPQGNYLFEVSDKLAWVHNYYALTDTTAVFTYKMEDGVQESVSLDFPAGKGSFILWLDSDLNILDHWTIPYENNNIGGLNIKAITKYNGDTLLIQGTMNAGTTSSLDPFGASSESVSEVLSTFFAFYSAPDILTRSKNPEAIQTLQIYPNPATDNLRISGITTPNSSYIIYDLSGRLISKGDLRKNDFIDIQGLQAGMYILVLNTENPLSTAKFVVKK